MAKIDAKNKVLGRIATDVALILMGKHKASFERHIAGSEEVVVYNIGEMKITGRKMKQKMYRTHSGYIGHLKELRMDEVWERDPRRVLEHAVNGMLPKNRLRKLRMKRLKMFVGEAK